MIEETLTRFLTYEQLIIVRFILKIFSHFRNDVRPQTLKILILQLNWQAFIRTKSNYFK